MNEFIELMKEHNPFVFKNEKGKPCVFKTYSDAYYEMCERIYKQAPRGYLDCVLFLVDNCGMVKNQAEGFLENFVKLGALSKDDEGLCMIYWSDKVQSEQILERIAKSLHWIIETEYNRSMFLDGLMRFRYNYNLDI